MSVFISGPVIALRLENKKMNKVIHMFGDNHSDVGYQTQCPQYDSIDFVKFFVKTISQTVKTKQYDLFFEVGSELFNTNIEHREKYIKEFTKYFKTTINIVNLDSKSNNKKRQQNIGSKMEPNLRLHHVDIREYFYSWIYKIVDDLKSDTEKILQIRHIDDNFVMRITQNVKLLIENIQTTTALVFDEKILQNNYSEQYFDKMKNIAKKMLHNYEHKNVKEILTSQNPFFDQIKNLRKNAYILANKLVGLCFNFNKLLNENYDKMFKNDTVYFYGVGEDIRLTHSVEIYKVCSELSNVVMDMYVFFMDLYFLRRLLDKKYVEKAIVYAGYMHISNYLYVLVKYFDFEITHITHTKLNIKEITKLITNSDEFNSQYFHKFMPEKLLQCIDYSFFPKNFE